MENEKREKFGSRLGFILVSAGCAVGLGNVWKFPYICGMNGGAAFILVYLGFLLLLGLPILISEFAIGRGSGKSVGSASPAADAEMISMADSLLKSLGLKNIELNINSIGCPSCRAGYHKALRDYFEEKKSDLCDTCLGRLERNPMRILDCKSPVCSKIAAGAPTVLEFLCDDCKSHFESVKKYLDAMDIEYTVNPQIVRGLTITQERFLNLYQRKSAHRAPFAAADGMTDLSPK